MEFGISKCAFLVMKRGKVSKCEGIRMPDAKVIRGLEGDGYKYLVIFEADDLKHAHMKEAISKEYSQCKGNLNNTLWCRDYQVDQRRTQEAG